MFMWRNVVMRVCAIVEVYVYEMMSLVDFFFLGGGGARMATHVLLFTFLS